jgi:prevent-host-death family protein
MKQVPVAAFKDKVSQYIAEAEAGDEIVITRHGKATAKLVAVSNDRMKAQREAIAMVRGVGQKILKERGPTPIEDIVRWIQEDRK